MKKILITLLAILVLQACEINQKVDKDKYYDIPVGILPILKDNDTVYFISNKGIIDAFWVQVFDDYEVIDGTNYIQRILVRYHNLDSFSHNLIFSTYQSASVDNSNITSISANGDYYPFDYFNNEPVDCTIGSKNYIGVYVLQKLTNPDTIPNTIYYSHNFGILRYDYSDSLYYELKSTIE